MLSRVAHSIYWMSRYLERVEHAARVIDVNLVLALDQTPAYAEQRWERMLRSLQVSLPEEVIGEPQKMVQMLLFDRDASPSIIAMLTQARDNARQVRNQLSTEMWEQLNLLYLQVSRATVTDIWGGQTHALFRQIKEGIHLFHGITEATLRQDESWHFLRIGRFLERAEATIALLHAYFSERAVAQPEGVGRDYLDLVGLLKSRTAFEAYCQVYTADLQPDRIAGFLLFSTKFPHSVRFAAEHVQTALQTVAELTHARNSDGINRHAGRLRATLDYMQIEDVMTEGLVPFLEDLENQFGGLHKQLYGTYFQPPIQAVVAW